MAWLRVVGAAIAVLAVVGLAGGAWRGWTRRQLAAAAIFGIATAAMNTFFYLAIDRTDLGKSVAIEFIGPIAVAAVMTRTPRNAGALALAATGVIVLGGVELGDNLLGLAVPARRVGAAGRRTSSSGRAWPSSGAGVAGLGIGLAIGALVLTPFGAPGSGPAWTSVAAARVLPARRRLLQRHRLRHRPVRAAADPDAPVLACCSPCSR